MIGVGDWVNHHEFRFVGMSRSGNHAIINWALQQMQGKSCFLNCVEPGCNPFESARPASDGGACYVASYPIDLKAEAAGQFLRKDYLLYSYEDCYLGMVADPAWERRHDQWLGPSRHRRDILVLRDPYNLFASRSRSGLYQARARGDQPNLVTRAVAARIWKQHAREFLQPGRYLRWDPVVISFNRWAADPIYRQQLALELGLPFRDDAADTVPSTAGGSSFDGTLYDGQARLMPVQGRWRHFQDQPDFWKSFDPKMIDYAKRIFDMLPDPAERVLEAEQQAS